ncbi:secreted Ly-6/uPAR-related protein 1-like [Spea bombifrons]|uniref:secreted Ly-6/uPAR-related protein 1-like n=1 Tax=Spea bombifrons TaxID=233779 RepID=UPI00234BFE8A|nr:secreted Ly-6/uPAR-related protein 1-like [Spea bombifrons]
MKTITMHLLLAALSLDLAFSLKCHVCYEVTQSRDCRDEMVCSPESKVCKTVVYSPQVGFPFNGEEMVTRSCATSCVENDPYALGNDKPVFCCTIDLCNNRGLYASNSTANSSGAVTGSYRTLAASIAIICALLRV